VQHLVGRVGRRPLPPGGGRTAPLSPGFRRLLAATTVAGLGDGVRQSAFPLLCAAVTRSPGVVAAVATVQMLPWIVLSLPAGVLVDRWDRRRLVIAINASRAAVAAALAVAVAARVVTVPALLAAAFVLGAAEVVADNAGQALLSGIVPADALERANGRLFATQMTTIQFFGPPLGGLLFGLRRVWPFAADAVAFAAAALLVRRIDPLPVPADTSTVAGDRTRVADGLRFLFGHRMLRGIAIVSLTGNLAVQVFYAVFVLFSIEELHVGSIGFGTLYAASAVGAVAGTAVASPIRRAVGAGPAMLGAASFMGLPLLAVGLVPDAALAGAALFLTGVAEGVWQVIGSALRQRLTPQRLQGRVLSAYRLIGRGGGFVGAALGGVIAETLSLRAPAIVAGLLTPVISIAMIRSMAGAPTVRA
jgi:MFS family permease